MSVHSAAELLALAADPGWADGADAELLAVRLDGAADLTDADRARLGRWLGELPVPVIGIGDAGPLHDAVDVVVATTDELERLVGRIRENPRAAAVLVQVLRSTARATIMDGLVLESLAYGALQASGEFQRWLEKRGAASPAEPDRPVLRMERRGERLDITLDSPRNRNALSAALRDALTEAFTLVAMDDGIREVHVRGNGPCFSAGGDLTEFGTSRDPAAAHRVRMRRMPARYLAAAADRYHFHLHGACIGAGIELPAFAGRITATADAFFQLPEVAMGLIPGAGGCVSIPRRIGRQRTAWLALSNERIDAAKALEWGLIDAIAR
ncbi:MAG TPA: enoyl-CoA hydratase/isomerase family protein [Pseudomonadales bacterium]